MLFFRIQVNIHHDFTLFKILVIIHLIGEFDSLGYHHIISTHNHINNKTKFTNIFKK